MIISTDVTKLGLEFATPVPAVTLATDCTMEPGTDQNYIDMQVNHDCMMHNMQKGSLFHCRLNSNTIYWKIPISILGMSGYHIYIFLEKNG